MHFLYTFLLIKSIPFAHVAIHCTVKGSFLGKLQAKLIIMRTGQLHNMPAKMRYAGTVHVHIPVSVRREVAKIMKTEDKTQAEAVRELLAIGLKTRGIEC